MSDRARRRDRFWAGWLVLASAAFVPAGVAVAVWPDAWFLSPWTARVEAAFGATAEAAATRRFLAGPLGATIAGFYVLQTAVAAGPVRRGEPWGWWAIVAATAVWFLTDSTLSLTRGAAFNVWLVNLGPPLLFGPPLVALRPGRRAAG